MSPIAIPNQVGFVQLSQVGVFVASINKMRSCKTPGCAGYLLPVAVSKALDWAEAFQFVLAVMGQRRSTFSLHNRASPLHNVRTKRPSNCGACAKC